MSKKKLKNISKIRGNVLGIEMALSILEDDLSFVEEKLSFLTKVEEDLIYNIDFLRKPEIISVMSEYHKSITELKVIRKEIIKNRNLKIKIQKDIEKNMKSYDYYMDKLEQAYKDMEEDKVILLFKRKDDGEQ